MADKIRIIYLSSNLGIHDQRFLRKLVDAGYLVHLITHYPHMQLPDGINSLGLAEILQYEEPLAFSYGAGKYGFFSRKLRCWLAFLRSFVRFKKDIKRINPDLIHAGWVQNEGFLAALSGFKPWLLMPWGSDILINPNKSWRIRRKTKFTISRADMIACDAESVKQHIIELSGYPAGKIVVFPWGVDLSHFNRKEVRLPLLSRLGWEGKKILLMIRMFEPIYGIEYFIEALPEIIRAEPDARVILAGDGSLKGVLMQKASEMGLDNYVHFAGLIKNEDLPIYFNSANIYISSSLSDGASLSLLEAMACGLPVVVSDVQSYYEWIKDGENGYIVPRRDPQLLAQRIIALLRDDNNRRRFGSKNLEIARQRADWGKNFGKLEEIYRELVGIRNNA